MLHPCLLNAHRRGLRLQQRSASQLQLLLAWQEWPAHTARDWLQPLFATKFNVVLCQANLACLHLPAALGQQRRGGSLLQLQLLLHIVFWGGAERWRVWNQG